MLDNFDSACFFIPFCRRNLPHSYRRRLDQRFRPWELDQIFFQQALPPVPKLLPKAIFNGVQDLIAFTELNALREMILKVSQVTQITRIVLLAGQTRTPPRSTIASCIVLF
jgi:hypothetical protein